MDDTDMASVFFITLILVCSIFVSFITIAVIHSHAVTTMPDGRKFIALAGNKYWVEKWENKAKGERK